MKKKFIELFIVVILCVSFVLAGCSSPTAIATPDASEEKLLKTILTIFRKSGKVNRLLH